MGVGGSSFTRFNLGAEDSIDIPRLGVRVPQADCLDAGAMTAEQAASVPDEASIEVFWGDWPDLRSWTGALWRTVYEDRVEPAREVEDAELDEVGGGD
jgi:hypothetical protein